MKSHLLCEQTVHQSAPQESKNPCCPRYVSHSFGEHPQRFPWRHQEFVMPGKTQTTATQSCKWKHIKKQLKKSSPADPRQEGKACFGRKMHELCQKIHTRLSILSPCKLHTYYWRTFKWNMSETAPHI